MWVMWNLVSVHLETMLVSVEDRFMVGARFEPNKSRKSFWKHPMELLCDEAEVKSCFGPFGYSVGISAR